jgi:hypothetical protein
MRRIRRHLSYANVASTLALLVAIAGGTAIAGSNAPKNSVTTNSIKPHHVTARDLAGIRVVEVDQKFSAFAPCGRRERLLGGGGSSIGAGLCRCPPSQPGRTSSPRPTSPRWSTPLTRSAGTAQRERASSEPGRRPALTGRTRRGCRCWIRESSQRGLSSQLVQAVRPSSK